MRATFATVAFAALAAANPMPSGAPSTSAPAGCKGDYPGTFNIELVNVTTGAGKRSMEKRDLLTLKLAGGILTDALGRIGSIVANGQFQFDGPPPQAGAEYTAGWTVCANNTLTLGAQTVFYECLTSNYYNIYDRSLGGQCAPVWIQAINGAGGAAQQGGDGQVTATPVSPVSQISDGQPQATTGSPVTQISDGQPQGPTGKPVTQISDGQPQAPTGVPVSQISDGQPQAPTGKPVTQISDGQPQAPAGPTGNPVSQISDGQPQAPTATPSRSPIPAVNATIATSTRAASPTASTPAASTGGAVANAVGAFGIVAGAVAFALL